MTSQENESFFEYTEYAKDAITIQTINQQKDSKTLQRFAATNVDIHQILQDMLNSNLIYNRPMEIGPQNRWFKCWRKQY